MPGTLLHLGAQVNCLHLGKATPVVTNPRVKVSGQPTVTQATSYGIVGCTLPPPPNGNGPCATAQWVTAAIRVRSNGQPLLLFDSQSICTPSGTKLVVIATQARVRGM
jgi:hypothetical protein